MSHCRLYTQAPGDPVNLSLGWRCEPWRRHKEDRKRQWEVEWLETLRAKCNCKLYDPKGERIKRELNS